jgi:hypothetical protein
MGYDIIGDIHGHADKLEALLLKLGYRRRQGAWRHTDRTAIFVGDFIDRGRLGVETVRIVRAMVDAGAAQAIMGNHELNAIAWHTPDARLPGEYLRPHHGERWGAKNRKQHAAFLAEVEHDSGLHKELIDWFLTLPLWLDLPELRVVHACWHEPFITWLSGRLHNGHFLTRELMVDATDEPAETEKDNPNPSVFKAIEVLTKGIEIPLPKPHTFVDKDGITRNRVRTRWWEAEATTYRQIALLSDEERAALPDIEVPAHARLPTTTSAKPIFFGHYWMTGSPRPLSSTAICVDYSAGKGGPLVAYCWDAGEPLTPHRFVGAQ